MAERTGEVGSFTFEGVEVEAFVSGDGQWHVRSAGCEVEGAHLGTAIRTLFNPDAFPNASQLIQEILAWASAGENEDVTERDAGWMTSPRSTGGYPRPS
jgi:hypothetical protein